MLVTSSCGVPVRASARTGSLSRTTCEGAGRRGQQDERPGVAGQRAWPGDARQGVADRAAGEADLAVRDLALGLRVGVGAWAASSVIWTPVRGGGQGVAEEAEPGAARPRAASTVRTAPTKQVAAAESRRRRDVVTRHLRDRRRTGARRSRRGSPIRVMRPWVRIDGVVGDREGRPGELLDEQDGDALLGERADQLVELGDDQRARDPSRSRRAGGRAGSTSSARDIASICCSPPDSVPASCLRRSPRRGNRVNVRSATSAALAALPTPVHIRRFSSTVRLGKTPRPSGIRHTPAWASAAGLGAVDVHATDVQAARRSADDGAAGDLEQRGTCPPRWGRAGPRRWPAGRRG